MSRIAFADASPSEEARARGIEEILHYTSSKGILGILATGAVKSRARLEPDLYLAHVFHAACAVRKDIAHLDYVNLSVSQINLSLFQIASERWERNADLWWAILSFPPEVLDHDGVIFSTTNNIYPARRHGVGGAGLRALFAGQVTGRYGNVTTRPRQAPASRPTDPEAEVLYPGELSTGFLQRIYVANAKHRATVLAQCDAVGHVEPDVLIRPDVFH